MQFVIFQLVISSSAESASEKYYIFLQNLLKTQPGFVSEIPYASPVHSNPARQVLVAQFVDEESVRNWRLQHDHLAIQYKARNMVFDDYRLRVGPETAFPSDVGEGSEGMSHTVVLYERPNSSVTGEAAELSLNVLDLIDRPAKNSDVDVAAGLVDTMLYQGEEGVLWISGWKDKAAAILFEESIGRIEGDSLKFIQVERDYGKFDRKEAPKGADAAQEASVDENAR